MFFEGRDSISAYLPRLNRRSGLVFSADFQFYFFHENFPYTILIDEVSV